MRKSYLRGTRLKIFFAILFVLFSIASTISLYKDYMRSAEVQYKEGKQFQKSKGYTFIKVEALEELDIIDDSLKDNQKFYMLQHEHGFVMLKASKDDVKKLIQSNDIPNEKLIDLKDKNIYSRVDAIYERGSKGRKNISPELKEKFKNAAEHSSLIRARVSDIVNEIVIKKSVDGSSSKLQEKPFLSQFYLTVPGKGYYIGTYGTEVVILLITFFLIKSVIKNIRKNKAEYEELFIEYPEAERDLDILVREAKYINKKLKALIYKDALILYGKGFNFQLLSGFSKVTFDREIRKGRVVSYIAHFHNNFETDEKVKVCSNYKNSREDIDELGKTLKQTFGKTVRYNY
ncbi:hypothetical protein PNO24_05270 [Gemella haemolysans]|uniref:hypothetical protein n=1 Tax=Gemella haemolysans TaxID=1379 RepID=UPI00233154A3|nr:hypothetical protein [Gemella haemolysans]MDB6213335.1 hypothetical protein [Gemella haemolysans]